MNEDNLHMLSEYGVIIENPSEDIKEKLRLLKEQVEINWEIKADNYINRRYGTRS